MTVSGESMMDERLYKEAVRMMMSRAIVVTRIIGLAMAALGLLFLMSGGLNNTLRGALLIVAGIAYAWGIAWAYVWTIARRTRPARVSPWQFELTDQGMRMASALGSSDVPWSSFTGFDERPGFWLVHTTVKKQSVIIPKAAFSADDQATVSANLPRLVGRTSPVQPR